VVAAGHYQLTTVGCAWQVYHLAKAMGVQPTNVIVNGVLKAAARAGQPEVAIDVFTEAKELGVTIDKTTTSAFIRAFLAAHQPEQVRATALPEDHLHARKGLDTPLILHWVTQQQLMAVKPDYEPVLDAKVDVMNGDGLNDVTQCEGISCMLTFVDTSWKEVSRKSCIAYEYRNIQHTSS
jgi:pentatricopeptide repeat protein